MGFKPRAWKKWVFVGQLQSRIIHAAAGLILGKDVERCQQIRSDRRYGQTTLKGCS
jgi:hypothetical protein